MPNRFVLAGLIAIAASAVSWRSFFVQQSASPPLPQRNVIIFVADGLRDGSVNETDAPSLSMIRKQGVYYALERQA